MEAYQLLTHERIIGTIFIIIATSIILSMYTYVIDKECEYSVKKHIVYSFGLITLLSIII